MKPAIAVALASLASAAHPVPPVRYMTADLVTETEAPRPGTTILLGFRMTPQPGWHGYWRNPGDSGIAPLARWTLPPGVTAGPLLHPPPELLVSDGISSFVHGGPHVLLAKLSLPRTLKAGDRLPITAALNWAACTATRCVPMRQTFTLDLVAGDGTPGPDAGELKRSLAQVPHGDSHGTFAVSGRRARLTLPSELKLNPRNARFFPSHNGFFDASSARASRQDDGLVIEANVSATAIPRALNGVVSDGAHAYRIVFGKAAAPTLAEASPNVALNTETAAVAASTAGTHTEAREAKLSEAKHAREGDPGPRGLRLWLAAAIFVLAIVAWLSRRFYRARR